MTTEKLKCFKDEWLNELFSEYIRSAYPGTPDFKEWEKENSEPSGDYYGFLVKLFRKAYETGKQQGREEMADEIEKIMLRDQKKNTTPEIYLVKAKEAIAAARKTEKEG